MRTKRGYTYILSSPTGVLYIGVTSHLRLRIFQHRNGIYKGFSHDYNCTRLVYFERFNDIRNAIRREKQFKGWRREKKLTLIRTRNPELKDLAQQWGWRFIGPHQRISDQLD